MLIYKAIKNSQNINLYNYMIKNWISIYLEYLQISKSDWMLNWI